jgi:hypothetical protein
VIGGGDKLELQFRGRVGHGNGRRTGTGETSKGDAAKSSLGVGRVTGWGGVFRTMDFRDGQGSG